MSHKNFLSIRWSLLAAAACLAITGNGSRAEETLQSSVAGTDGNVWITHPLANGDKAEDAAISLQFRKEFRLADAPKAFPIRISADNRYVLYVNGERVAAGPSRGDLEHWRYEVVDLAPHLRAGSNVVAVQVWNDGADAPRAQLTAGTGLLIRAENASAAAIDAGPAWQVRKDDSRTVSAAMPQLIEQMGGTYYVAGAPETHYQAHKSADWNLARATSRDWIAAVPATGDSVSRRVLVADDLPQMDYRQAPGGTVVRVRGNPAITVTDFPKRAILVPPHSDISILVDTGKIEAAYPEFGFRGGSGAQVNVTYAEALYGPDKQHVADRAAVGDNQAFGPRDTFWPDGSAAQAFTPFWWRVWRFAELRVRTQDKPLELTGVARHLTGYPFQKRAWFRSDDAELNRIWDIGWDTLRVDAHETFMDSSYWEQMQYIGDTRIEALIADMVSGDPRLSLQAIRTFDASRSAKNSSAALLNPPLPELAGLPQAAWPSASYQSIPPFALLWVGMLDDYRMRWPAQDLVREMMPGARTIVDWFGGYVGSNGLVGKTPGWTFLDWKPNLQGTPDGKPTDDQNTCVVTLMYLGALRQAAALEDSLGDAAGRARYATRADAAAKAIRSQCWSQERGLYADNPARDRFSQHANVLAVLYDVVPAKDQAKLLERVTLRGGGIAAPAGLTGTSYYFSYYLARALDHAGLADRYHEMLATWRGMLKSNFTTWPENPDPSRSDTHAWSAHPTADLLSLVAGIQPAAPGYGMVKIAPHLGSLKSLSAAAAHPKGLVEVRYQVRSGTLEADVTLPGDLRGAFEWQGQRRDLVPGANHLSLAAASTVAQP